jgi:hypothetical protein
MKYLIAVFCMSIASQSYGKMELSKEIKRGPITKDACGNFEDGIKSLQRIQDTSTFESDGQIALYNFSARAMAALYHEKMLHEKNKSRRAYFRDQYQLACRNSG